MSDDAPRWLDRLALARHISVRVDLLPRMQSAGRLPEPSFHLGPRSPRWDRAAIDALFHGTSSQPAGIDAIEQEAVNAIIRRAEARRATDASGRFSQRIPIRSKG